MQTHIKNASFARTVLCLWARNRSVADIYWCVATRICLRNMLDDIIAFYTGSSTIDFLSRAALLLFHGILSRPRFFSLPSPLCLSPSLYLYLSLSVSLLFTPSPPSPSRSSFETSLTRPLALSPSFYPPSTYGSLK